MKKSIKQQSTVMLVWSTWKSSFKENSKLLILTFLFYNASAFFNEMLKPYFFKSVFDSLEQKSDPMKFFYLMIAAHMVAWVFSRLGDYSITISESGIIKSLRDKTMKGLMKKNLAFFTNSFAGSLVTKSKRFSTQSETVVDQFAFTFSKTLVLAIYIFVYMSINYPTIGLIFMAWSLIFVAFTVFIARKRMPVDKESSEKDSKTTGVFSDIISSISYVRAYSAEYAEYQKFKEVTKEEMQARRKAWFLGNFQWATQSILVIVLEFVVIGYMVRGVINGSITIGTLAMVQVYIISLSNYMYQLGQALIRMRTGFADAYEMSEILIDQSNNSEVVEEPKPLKIKDKSISLENLSFSYKTRKVLENFDLNLLSGRHYGMVGTSGAGKTTIVQLILHNYSPQSGIIKIGGVDISKISKPTLRSMISYVQQSPNFPSRSVLEILKLGNRNASMDQIKLACKKAGCDFIWNKFEEGFDTKVGERGVKLSGGEAQRLAIAAAIVKDAPIVIMDEPTSALDAETEQIIQSSIKEIFKGKTMIVIAHRLSTVAVLDEILLIKDGSVQERGTHNEMLENSFEYKKLWDLQTKPNILAIA